MHFLSSHAFKSIDREGLKLQYFLSDFSFCFWVKISNFKSIPKSIDKTNEWMHGKSKVENFGPLIIENCFDFLSVNCYLRQRCAMCSGGLTSRVFSGVVNWMLILKTKPRRKVAKIKDASYTIIMPSNAMYKKILSRLQWVVQTFCIKAVFSVSWREGHCAWLIFRL